MNMIKPIVINALETEGCCVPKGWGDEIIIENNEMYYNLANNIAKNQLTLGWIMGFRNNSIIKNGKNTPKKYEGLTSYEAENCYDGGVSNKYYLLSYTKQYINPNNLDVSYILYKYSK